MTYINLDNDDDVSYKSIKNLTNLTAMRLCDHRIKDEELMKLTNLKSLELDNGSSITGAVIRAFTHLESLILYRNDNVTNEDICKLTNLRKLYLEDCWLIDANGIENVLPKSIQYTIC